MIIWTIQVLVQLNHQRLEERRKLPLLFGGFILGYSRLQSKRYRIYECKEFCLKYLNKTLPLINVAQQKTFYYC